MPRSTFEAAVANCHLSSTTYTMRKWFWMDEPLINFSAERDPKAAHRCFNDAFLEVDEEELAHTHAEHSGYIWSTQE